ncbi:EamA family transporter [Neobacillus niacini]|uniref:EamA family transporter n=1 Tax=Neobacillus niacini TaxID=86668 RepID=UPI00286D4EFF|nr:EamA family transporter [Neobacillus niacini]
MTFFGSLGGYFFKKASSHSLGFNKGFLFNLCLGGFFYVLGALLNILLLKYLPYTIVYPLTSITYLWTMILSYFLLSEKINYKKIGGVSLIGLGSFLLVV